MKGDRNDLPSIAGTFGGGSPFYRVPYYFKGFSITYLAPGNIYSLPGSIILV